MELREDGTSRGWNFEVVEFYTRLRYSSSRFRVRGFEFEVSSSRFRVLTTEHRTIENRTLEFEAPSSKCRVRVSSSKDRTSNNRISNIRTRY